MRKIQHTDEEDRAEYKPEKNRKHSGGLAVLTVTICVLALAVAAVTGFLLLQYHSRIQQMEALRQEAYTAEVSAAVSEEPAAFGTETAAEPVAENSVIEETAAPSPSPEEPAPVEEGSVAETDSDVTEPMPTCKQAIDFTSLHQTNRDIYAWITVPGTTVDYPILQTEEDDYYLLHNLDGSSGYPGCIYTNASCNSTSFTDSITVAYGHNMPQGTMFTSLHNLEDETVFNENETFTVYTEQNRLTYEIVAEVWYSDDYIPYYFETTSGQAVVEFWDSILTECDFVNEPSRIREGTEITMDDHLFVLSTCCRVNGSILEGRRYLVVGRLIETAVFE